MTKVKCQMKNVKRRMANVKCEMSNVECQTKNDKCQISNEKCLMSILVKPFVRAYLQSFSGHFCDKRKKLSSDKSQRSWII